MLSNAIFFYKERSVDNFEIIYRTKQDKIPKTGQNQDIWSKTGKQDEWEA